MGYSRLTHALTHCTQRHVSKKSSHFSLLFATNLTSMVWSVWLNLSEPFSSQTPQTPTWVQAFYSTNIELIRALPCCTSMNHKATDQIDMWHTGRNVQHAGTQMMYISHRDTWNHQMNLIHWCSACCGGFLTEVKHKWMVSVLPPAAVHVIVHGSSINTWCQCKVVWGQINPFC